jgi:Cof subfamily protein (haloacid dehalogenase superfamily)
MSMVKLLALDLDDTLLRQDLSFSRRTRSVLKKAEDQGLVVVLASGRAPKAMERYARELDMHKRPGFIICNNGVSVYRTDTWELVQEQKLPIKPALLVYDFVDSEGLPVQVYDDESIYVSKRNEFADQDIKLTGFRQVVVENFRAMIAAGQTKMVIPGDPMYLAPLEKILKNIIGDDLTIFTSKPYFLEILPPDCGKGQALAFVAKELGISRSSVMAVGDSMNDESMIRWAGWGVAMSNGVADIKQLASFITDKTNEEDGVAALVEEFILGEREFPVPPRSDA